MNTQSMPSNLLFGARFKVSARDEYDTPDKLNRVLPVGLVSVLPYREQRVADNPYQTINSVMRGQSELTADQYVIGKDPKNFFPRIEFVTQLLEPKQKPNDRNDAIMTINRGEQYQIKTRPEEYKGVYEYEVLTASDMEPQLTTRRWNA